MAASEKRVNIKVETEANLKNIEALEVKVRELQKQRIQVNIDTAERGLEETKAKIAELENKKLELDVDADASEITKIDDEIDKLNYKVLDLELDVETGELEKAKAEAEELDGTSIDVDVNNITAMEAIDQIGQGFDRLKQGASEVGEQMGELLESAGKQQTNKTFLEMQLGAEGASKALSTINDTVQQLPGDDTALQGLLSQAAAKNASITADELNKMGVAAADYFSAMSYYGKSATEAQQDMLNYLLAGNTAEIERSPILSQHIDDLKNANSVQERSVALQKALTEEGWGGMSMQDTYNNKLETFNGMLERGKYNLGGMFMEGASGAMDFVMQLDSATGGLVGMSIAAASLASPISDTIIGLGQMVIGINALRDAEILSAAAGKAAAAAQWALDIAMDANPIMLVVLAITALIAVLGYLYFNNETVRAAIDGLGQSLMYIGQIIWGFVSGAIQWLSDLFNQFTQQLGLNTNDWTQAVLGFILFLPTLPAQVAIALVNTLARVLGFKGNFVQSLISAAANAVSGFVGKIKELYGIVQSEFARIEGLVSDFITSLPKRVWDLGASIVSALKSALGIGSPGFMYYMFEGELNRLKDLPTSMKSKITHEVEGLGSGIVDSFSPKLDYDFPTLETANNSLSGGSSNNMPTIINLSFEGCMFDKEERVQEIKDVINKEVNWNNITAGRSV